MPRKKRFEDKTDPDKRRGGKPWSLIIRQDEGGNGRAYIFDVDERNESVVVNIWSNGEMTAFIEKDVDND